MLLNGIFCALAAVGAALLCGLTPLSPWWGLPIALGLYIALGLLYIIWFFTTAMLLPQKRPSLRRYTVYHQFIVTLLDWVLLLIGVRPKLYGSDKLPTDTPFLVVGNHLSNFDPLVTLAAFRHWNLGFVSKPENFKIPFVGTAMQRACFLAIDRENARNAVTAIKQAAEQISDMGLSMMIYPEGTRNKTGEGLLPFHAGSFKIAKLANCPVAVATIRYEKRGLFSKRVTLRIVDVMDTAYVTENNTATLSDHARKQIEADLNNG